MDFSRLRDCSDACIPVPTDGGSNGLPIFRFDCESIRHSDTTAFERWLNTKSFYVVAIEFEPPDKDVFLPEWEPFREFSKKLLDRIPKPFLRIHHNSLIMPILGSLDRLSMKRAVHDGSVHVQVPIDTLQWYLLEKCRGIQGDVSPDREKQLDAMLQIGKVFGFSDEDWLDP